MKSNVYLIAGALIAVLIIALVILVAVPVPSANPSADPSVNFQQAGALYTKSVDLANDGKYTEALKAADDALALNSSQLIPIIQSNRAGILVMLGRNADAITAADAALSSHENLTTTFSIAYFNKGNALKNLNRTEEAKAAYNKAHELDPTLVSPI
ncbi:tetratricopeptide repeat protein [uncultured Methanoregula sp.]|uniref:tetratricopeptide repeat protein n=1 Tax=uncultured Methanoregula sp. TaxID=1005933 RepID=UPI002AAB713F|nr:tetratricopeptide repeat protein [uncultured Methanoregula sp.]